MEKNIFLFAQSGGLFFVMFMLFFIGLAIKVAVGLIYDNAIEKSIVFEEKSPVGNIICKYSMNFSGEKMCKNTNAFVDNELHNWKVCGFFVERFNDIGNIILGVVFFLCIVFDMVLLLSKTAGNIEANLYMKYIYFYTLISLIMLIVIKGFDIFINIKNKKIVLRDKIVNYLDNNCGADEYATIKANIYIDKENIDVDKKQINELDDGKDSVKETEESKITVKKDGSDVLLKNDKEKVIEQVLEEFLV